MSTSPPAVLRASPSTSSAQRDNARKRKKHDELPFRSQQLRRFLLMRDGSEGQEMNFVGSATGIIYFIRAVHNAMVIDGSQVNFSNQTPESDHPPGEDHDGPTNATGTDWKYLWSALEVCTAPTIFTFDNLLDWSRSYFSNWHPAYPFLHAPSMLDYFRRVTEYGLTDREPSDPLLKTILRSIMSISLADSRQSSHSILPVPTTLIFTSYNAAIESISHILMQPSSMLAIQAIISVILFLVSMLRFNAASRLEGLAVRMAYQLGIHRCPFKYSTKPSHDALLSVRIFWSLYCIDRFINPSLGLPPAISDAEIDVCIPDREQHLQYGEDSSPHDNRLDLMCFLARHAKIRGSIMSLRDRSLPRSQADTELSKTLDTDLTQWQNDLDDYIDIHDGQETAFSEFHIGILTILRCESQMALHRPMLASTKDGPFYRTGLQNCISAARKAINTLYEIIPTQSQQEKRSSSEICQTGLLWPSFTWATWLSAFVIIYAGTESEVTEGISVRLVARGTDILRHLSLRGSVWPDACIVATRELQALLFDEQRSSAKTSKTGGMRPSRDSRTSGNLSSNSVTHQTGKLALSSSHSNEPNQNLSTLQSNSHMHSSSRDQSTFSNPSLPNDNSEHVPSTRSRALLVQSNNLPTDQTGHTQGMYPSRSASMNYDLDFNLAFQSSTSLPPMLNDETNDMIYFGWQAHDANANFEQQETNYGSIF